ncbi:MAG TPA: GGDEF domain-containing protein [Steroidobacteraceae bacterium]|jgi:EAL domain-containing protein (putative c-di-GMP-specific phosphodiesterase class I)/GGDEF domain-containing protein
MLQHDLLAAFPDLIVQLNRHGTVMACGGGRGVAELRPATDPTGQRIESLWPESMTGPIRQLAADVIDGGNTIEITFSQQERNYDMRICAQDHNTALCLVRALPEGSDAELHFAGDTAPKRADRHAELRHFRESVSVAAVRRRPVAAAVVQLCGVSDIQEVISCGVSAQVMKAALRRLEAVRDRLAPGFLSSVGWLSEDTLLLILGNTDPRVIDSGLTRICDSLRQPVALGDATFHLTPHAGAAILGRDASSARELLRHARDAATEARRTSSSRTCFFSSKALGNCAARLDLASDLKEAIPRGEMRLRYTSRHDLASGRLVTWVASMVWRHPTYGEVQTPELLRLAEITGMSRTLSQAALERLQKDFALLYPRWDADVRVSFGAPRQHVLDESFIGDIQRALAARAIPPERLELRIPMRTALARDPADFSLLARCGVHFLVEDVGNTSDLPLDWLARAPVAALQLNPQWVGAVRRDPGALKMCRATVGLAKSFGLISVAAGVDEPEQRRAVLTVGCIQGTGLLYTDEPYPADRADMTGKNPVFVAA